jgi:hypothetical protein
MERLADGCLRRHRARQPLDDLCSRPNNTGATRQPHMSPFSPAHSRTTEWPSGACLLWLHQILVVCFERRKVVHYAEHGVGKPSSREHFVGCWSQKHETASAVHLHAQTNELLMLRCVQAPYEDGVRIPEARPLPRGEAYCAVRARWRVDAGSPSSWLSHRKEALMRRKRSIACGELRNSSTNATEAPCSSSPEKMKSCGHAHASVCSAHGAHAQRPQLPSYRLFAVRRQHWLPREARVADHHLKLFV